MDVTIIIATYNPNETKLFDTLYSAINQRDIELEIIICDDCSRNDVASLCEMYLKDNNFQKYTIIKHHENVGTCKNIYDGVVIAKGKYIKIISPGDFIIGTELLKKWYDFANNSEYKITFSRIVNYYYKENQKILTSRKAQPANDHIYLDDNMLYDQKINYCYLSDTPVGAAYLTEREILEKYLELIIGRIRYAEDFIYRIALLDGNSIRMFPFECIAYECNTGISTSTSKQWSSILDSEMSEFYRIIEDRNITDRFASTLLKSHKLSKIYKIIYKCIFVRRYIYWNVRKKMTKKTTGGLPKMLYVREDKK